jgi:hypothetical protein
MMLTLILCMLFFQQDPYSPLERFLMVNAAKTHARPQSQLRAAELQRRLLSERFQKLLHALERFSDEYNKGKGNVWPLKEAEGLRKAYYDLERSMFQKSQPENHTGTE